MTSGLKTRNPLVLFEGNDTAISRPVARNPIVQADVVIPQCTPKKPVERNPLFGDGYAAKPVRASVNNKVARNPIVADPREFAVKVRDNNTFKDSDIFGGRGEPDNRPHTTKAKHTATFSSTVFGAPKIEPPTRKKLVTDLSTDQLFGDYREPAFKKPQPKKFDPEFVNMSPEQRRYKEVFGLDLPANPALEIKEERHDDQNKDAFTKKVSSMESNIFNAEDRRPHTTKAQKPKEKFFAKTQWNSQVSTQNTDNQRRDFDAKAKKQEEFSKSNIFGEQHENHGYVQKPPELQDDSNVDKRKQMRNYSDLFNLPQYENNPSSALERKKETDEKKHIVEEEKNLDAHSKRLKDLYSVLATDDITRNYKESLNSGPAEKPKEKKFDGKNTKDLKQLELKSSLQGNEVNYDNLKNPVFYDFDVKGVSPDFEPTKFKNFCSSNGYHLVDFKANMDSLNTGNDGTGRLKIRLGEEADLKEVKNKLSELGMDIDNHTEEHKLKHNYLGVAKLGWMDANLAGQERRLNGNEFLDAKESKMRDMESNGDMFGNSKGVGKWDPELKAIAKNKKAADNYTPEENVQALNWKKTINNLEKVKNPMYKAGTSFQSQKLFSSTSSKIISKNKK